MPSFTFILVSLNNFNTKDIQINNFHSSYYVPRAAEMLPTLIRSGGVGAFSMFSRFGALLAPFVPMLKAIFDFLPLLVFGAVAFVAGILAVFLPETLGVKLPTTIEEAEVLGKS